MGSTKREVTFEGNLDRQAAVALLKDLLAGIEAGTLSVQQGERALTVHPADALSVCVRAKSKGDKETFALELSWARRASSPADPGIKITPHEVETPA